jgi:hypothetical protein
MKPCMRPLRTQWACALIASRRIPRQESNVNESAFWNSAVMSVDKSSVPPPAPPPPIPHGMPITLELAKRVAAAAEAEAGKNGWPMAIAIAEPTGALVYFLKMDNVQYARSNSRDQGQDRAVYGGRPRCSPRRSATAISCS